MKKKQYSEEVIEAFITSNSRKEIVGKTGLSPRTINRYAQDVDFQKILTERKTEYIKASVSKMQAVMCECVDKLVEIIRAEDTAPQVRVNAIQCVFNQCREWTTSIDILDRLKAIEESQNGSE